MACFMKAKKYEVETLRHVNQQWRVQYSDLQMRYEMLDGEKKLIEAEEMKWREAFMGKTLVDSKEIKWRDEFIKELGGECSRIKEDLEAQCQVYKEDFMRERADRERIHEEKELLKQELLSSESIIKELILRNECDACRAAFFYGSDVEE